MNEKVFMTIREVAKTGILSEHTIRMMVKAGEVPHIKVGNRILINYPKFIEQLQITAQKGKEKENEENIYSNY